MHVGAEFARLHSAGQTQAAVELVGRSAAANDPVALFLISSWRLFGQFGPRDLGEAHRLLDRAIAMGHVDSILRKATLLANGTGCASDPQAAERLLRMVAHVDADAAAQLRLVGRINRKIPVAQSLSERPLIRAVRRLLTPDECRYLTGHAEPHLEPSVVEDPATGRRFPDPVRTSRGMSFGPVLEDLAVRSINRRLAAATGTEVGAGEPLHVLSYAPGEQYRAHVDFLQGVQNQREWTVLVYLNDEYQGGETSFEQPGISFRGKTGDALFFRNLDPAGAPDPATRHAGLPVTAGTKWLATRWIRQRAYHPWAVRD